MASATSIGPGDTAGRGPLLVLIPLFVALPSRPLRPLPLLQSIAFLIMHYLPVFLSPILGLRCRLAACEWLSALEWRPGYELVPALSGLAGESCLPRK